MAVEADRVVEALMAFDELLDGDVGGAGLTELCERAVKLRVGVDAHRSRCAGGCTGLEDDRVADQGDEVTDLRRAGGPGRLRRS